MITGIDNPSVLIVDDDALVLDVISIVLKSAGIEDLTLCVDPEKVFGILAQKKHDCMLLDLTMPGKGGEEILTETVAAYPDIPVIIVTGNSETETVVNCMKKGAADYLLKPVAKERLIATVMNTLKMRELQRENLRLKEGILASHPKSSDIFSPIITCSPMMMKIFKYIESVAASTQPVLITGETGTGKELISRAVHDASGRKGHFVSVNVAGLDDNVFTDTLFGHRKGAFTSADSSRSGLIKEASGGTLFLDEIGDLTLQSQVKLLRLLQTGEYYPLGSDMPLRSDARIVAATNKNLEEAQGKGEFRRDLYYRLYTHIIMLPPLRERREDIQLLADYFIEKSAREMMRSAPGYPRELITLLSSYDFPGNVREFESLVYDAVSRCESRNLSLDLFRERMPGIGIDRVAEDEEELISVKSAHFPSLKEAEKVLIRKAMEKAGNNQGIAASLLGISRQTLNAKLKD